MTYSLKIQETPRKPACQQYFLREEARHGVKRALTQWQQACDAWLSAKCSIRNRKDFEAIDQARTLKHRIDQASKDLKQALQKVNAVSNSSTTGRAMGKGKCTPRPSEIENGFCRAD
jgi:hypothetical protein